MNPIESGLPIPPVAGGGGRPSGSKYGWGEFDIGDSRLYPVPEFRTKNEYLRLLLTNARSHGKRSGKKFIARSEDGGVRIWRIE